MVSGVVTEGSSECGDGFVQRGVDTADVVGKSPCSRSNDLVPLARGRFAFEHDGAASSVALDQAVTLEGSVRAHHGVLRDAEISGELTNRRQLAPCDQDTAADLAVELAAELFERRDRRTRIDRDRGCHACCKRAWSTFHRVLQAMPCQTPIKAHDPSAGIKPSTDGASALLTDEHAAIPATATAAPTT